MPTAKPLSQAAVARALGMTPANLVKLRKQGCPVHSIEAAQAWREANQNVAARLPLPQDLQPDAEGASPGESHDSARTRLRIAEADLLELKLAEERGEVIRVEAVKAALSVAMATVREALLQIPSRLAPLLAADTDPASVQNLLHAEIHQTLEHLAGASDRLGPPAQPN